MIIEIRRTIKKITVDIDGTSRRFDSKQEAYLYLKMKQTEFESVSETAINMFENSDKPSEDQPSTEAKC